MFVNQSGFAVLPDRLNLGSGKDFRADAFNIDTDESWNPDAVIDLSALDIGPEGLAVETARFGTVRLQAGCFNHIVANDVLGHVFDLKRLMTACLALLRIGGTFEISVPFDLSYGAWQDPTSVRAFNERSWLYYTDWFWYLGWSEARFVTDGLHYVPSQMGIDLRERGMDRDEIARTPRAIDSMMVTLRKIALTAEDQAQWTQRRGSRDQAASANRAPVAVAEPVAQATPAVQAETETEVAPPLVPQVEPMSPSQAEPAMQVPQTEAITQAAQEVPAAQSDAATQVQPTFLPQVEAATQVERTLVPQAESLVQAPQVAAVPPKAEPTPQDIPVMQGDVEPWVEPTLVPLVKALMQMPQMQTVMPAARAAQRTPMPQVETAPQVKPTLLPQVETLVQAPHVEAVRPAKEPMAQTTLAAQAETAMQSEPPPVPHVEAVRQAADPAAQQMPALPPIAQDKASAQAEAATPVKSVPVPQVESLAQVPRAETVTRAIEPVAQKMPAPEPMTRAAVPTAPVEAETQAEPTLVPQIESLLPMPRVETVVTRPAPPTSTVPFGPKAFAGPWAAEKDRYCLWIVSPRDYPHAQAFDEVATGLNKAFAERGGSAPIVRNPSEWAGRTPLVLGPHLLTPNRALILPPGSILFNMEQVDGGSAWMSGTYLALLKRFGVLDYSRRNRDALAAIGVPHARHLPIGYARPLSRISPARNQDIDVLFYGSLNERRHAVLEALQARGVKVMHLFGSYGRERDAAIARAKIVLNMHYYDAAIFESVRVTYLLANTTCVVSEGDREDPDVAALSDGVALCSYDALVERCIALLADDAARKALAARGFERIRNLRQADLLGALFDGAATASPDRQVEAV